MLTFNPDFLLFCHDVISEVAPNAEGERFADLLEAALIEAQALEATDQCLLTPGELRTRLVVYLTGRSVEPGIAKRRARLNLYRELCWQWLPALETGLLSGIEQSCVIERAVSDVDDQIRDGVWPPGEKGRDRLRWLLHKSLARQLRC